MIFAGRGWGKTRTGAETVRQWVEDGARRIALIGRTSADTRDVMVLGESGLLAVFPPHKRPVYSPTNRTVTFHNGAKATLYSADEPDLLRGPQHDFGWCDELAAWRYPDAWTQYQMGLRLGRHPRTIVTTTPRPTKIIRDLVEESEREGGTVRLTRGKTRDNERNLAKSFLSEIHRLHSGTRLGRQELDGEVLMDSPGALWTADAIERCHMKPGQKVPDLRRVVVAVDPAVTSTETSDETGIVVAGIDRDGRGYVLADASGKYTPDQWAAKVVELYDRHQADAIVAEVNNGGDLVESNIKVKRASARVLKVRASRGKIIRAEPAAALYEQGKVSHDGVFAALEDQLTTWDASLGEKSPDRLDALVWALTELFVLAPPPAHHRKAPGKKSRWGATSPSTWRR